MIMRKFAFLWTMLVVLAFQVGPVSHAQADVVGRLTQVEGRVDLMRGGQLPATPVKLEDGVKTGDVLRTKSLSKAQITFIDNSILTIAPESRVGIEAYMFDSAQNKRNAVLQLFQGLAHAVVNKVFKSAEPDFVIKTHTAVMGIRGTEFGIRIHPNSSTILNFEGLLQVGNALPEVSQLSRRAFKLAYSFGSGARSGQNWVFLKDRQGTHVSRGQFPTPPFHVTQDHVHNFWSGMAGGSSSRKGGGTGSGSGSGKGGTGGDSGSGKGGTGGDSSSGKGDSGGTGGGTGGTTGGTGGDSGGTAGGTGGTGGTTGGTGGGTAGGTGPAVGTITGFADIPTGQQGALPSGGNQVPSNMILQGTSTGSQGNLSTTTFFAPAPVVTKTETVVIQSTPPPPVPHPVRR